MNYTARFNPHAATPAAVSGASVLRQFAVLLARAFALSGPHKPLGQSAAGTEQGKHHLDGPAAGPHGGLRNRHRVADARRSSQGRHP